MTGCQEEVGRGRRGPKGAACDGVLIELRWSACRVNRASKEIGGGVGRAGGAGGTTEEAGCSGRSAVLPGHSLRAALRCGCVPIGGAALGLGSPGAEECLDRRRPCLDLLGEPLWGKRAEVRQAGDSTPSPPPLLALSVLLRHDMRLDPQKPKRGPFASAAQTWAHWLSSKRSCPLRRFQQQPRRHRFTWDLLILAASLVLTSDTQSDTLFRLTPPAAPSKSETCVCRDSDCLSSTQRGRTPFDTAND